MFWVFFAELSKPIFCFFGYLGPRRLRPPRESQGYYCDCDRCLRTKRPLRKFDAKASFEVRSTASDVVFREQSEFEVENGPKPPTKLNFSKT